MKKISKKNLGELEISMPILSTEYQSSIYGGYGSSWGYGNTWGYGNSWNYGYGGGSNPPPMSYTSQ